MKYRLFPPDDILEANVELPLSKSVSARVLLINKLSGFETDAEVSDCEDIEYLRDALKNDSGEINIGDSGTALRFLTAFFASQEGNDVVLTGSQRLKERPLGQLVDALRSLGADIQYLEDEGFAPVRIIGRNLKGGAVNINASQSSQYISALMMIGPVTGGITIELEDEPASLPYIKMTAAMMEEAGAEVELAFNKVEVKDKSYSRALTKVERDWSAASFWYGVTALSAGWVTFKNMSVNSLQGDSLIITLGNKLGVNTNVSEENSDDIELSAGPEQFSRIDDDMLSTPDLVPPLAITAAVLGIPFRFTGVKNLAIKECNRLEALKEEALKLGFIFEKENDKVLTWEGDKVPLQELPVINPHGDHRIAMAFAPVSIFLPGMIIEDVEVVAKSYPKFWDDLRDAGFEIEEVE